MGESKWSTNNRKAFGAQLLSAREAKGESQESLAQKMIEKVGVNRGFNQKKISRLELGLQTKYLKDDELAVLSQLLDLSTESQHLASSPIQQMEEMWIKIKDGHYLLV